MRVLGIIPARGGSKGVHRKNIRLLYGKPLLEYTASAAYAAKYLTRVILSTEDEEIASIGRDLGIDVPFMRPPALARDDTPTLPVMIHAVEALEGQDDCYDAICLLQPTHPLRTSADIDACIQLLKNSEATAVVTILSVPAEYKPHWVYFQDKGGYLHLSTGEATPIPRRQLLPPAYHREGSVYLVRRDVLIEQKTLYGNHVLGVLIPSERSVNIDTLDDWAEAEKLLRIADS